MFDFTKMKKKFMTVKLDEETTILIGTPKKKGLENMFVTHSMLTGGKVSKDNANLIYEMVAELLSNNKNKIKITADYISDFELDNIVVFLQEYMKFVNDSVSAKN